MVNKLEGKKVVGIKQTQKAIRDMQCDKLYIAKDADNKLTEPLIELAKDKSLELIYIDTMKYLGKLCGIDVGAAVAATLKG